MAHKLEQLQNWDDTAARELAEALELVTGLAYVGLALMVGGPDLALSLGSQYSSLDLSRSLSKAHGEVWDVIRKCR